MRGSSPAPHLPPPPPGCLLSGDQSATQVVTAVYFICMDCVILAQKAYFASERGRGEPKERGAGGEGDRRRHGEHSPTGPEAGGPASRRGVSEASEDGRDLRVGVRGGG